MIDWTIFYNYAALFNIGIACIALFTRASILKRIVWLTLLCGWAFQYICHIKMASIFSLSGIAATCTLSAMTLLICQIVSLKKDRGSIRYIINAIWLILLGASSLVTEEYRHDSFMMTYGFAILFFLSRPLTIGFCLHAISGGLNCLKQDQKTNKRILGTSKDAAFLAAIVFLGGEIAGCYWGFMGWGTTWRWTGNFFYSAMVFVLLMIPLHIPRTVFKSHKSYVLAFITPLVIVVASLLLSKLVTG